MAETEQVRLQVGEVAPDFTVPTDEGGSFTLSEQRGRSVIVYFYPSAMTPGCTTEACDFSDSLAALQPKGYQVIGVSPDPIAKLQRFRSKDSLSITLGSDESRDVLRAYGAFGTKKNYGKEVQGVIRSTFLIDPDGKVALAQYNVRATGHVAKLRRDLKI